MTREIEYIRYNWVEDISEEKLVPVQLLSPPARQTHTPSLRHCPGVTGPGQQAVSVEKKNVANVVGGVANSGGYWPKNLKRKVTSLSDVQ